MTRRESIRSEIKLLQRQIRADAKEIRKRITRAMRYTRRVQRLEDRLIILKGS